MSIIDLNSGHELVRDEISSAVEAIEAPDYAYEQVDDNDARVDEGSKRRCEPLLDLPTYLKNQRPSSKRSNDSSSGINFSFAFGNIEMPIASPKGSLKAALDLVSSWSSLGDDISFSMDETDEERETPSNVIQFRDNRLSLRGLNLTLLNINLFKSDEPKFAIGALIKDTTLRGSFNYIGPKLMWTSTSISGFYRMSISDIMIVASSNLTKSNSDSGPQLKTNDFKLNITNIGYIDIDIMDEANSTITTSNSVLQLVRRMLLMTMKTTYFAFEGRIRETLERESRYAIDCELTRFSGHLDGSSKIIGQNDLAKIIRNEIDKLNFTSVPIPDYQHKQSFLGTTATIDFFNGTLTGLNHIKLSGETKIKFQQKHLLVNTSVAWTDLSPRYNWSLSLGKGRQVTKGFVSFNIKNIDFDTVISRGLDGREVFVVDQLSIEKLDNPRMDMGGLPGMNRLTRGTVNFIMNRMKQRMANSIQPILKNRLETSLNKLVDQ